MSDSSDNVVRLGGGGLLYEDAREQARQQAAKLREAVPAEDLAPDPPPWSDQPEPEPPAEPAKPSVVGVKNLPEPPPKEPRSFREPISTVLELVGIGLLITTGFLITVWAGTLIAGLCLIVLGVATSNQFSGPRN